jgi:hypothetical protein
MYNNFMIKSLITLAKKLRTRGLKILHFLLLKKYHYSCNLCDESPNHGYISIKSRSEKWEYSGYEKVGYDWHIRIRRKKDQKMFLLDRPSYYALQLMSEKKTYIHSELQILYGIQENNINKICQTLYALELC